MFLLSFFFLSFLSKKIFYFKEDARPTDLFDRCRFQILHRLRQSASSERLNQEMARMEEGLHLEKGV